MKTLMMKNLKKNHTDGEEDDEEIVTNEILSVANALEEEVEFESRGHSI
jgi:hypothetical protein